MKLIAAFEALKGLVVLLAGLAALHFVHRDLREVAGQIVRHLHLDPVGRVPRLILELSDKVTPLTLVTVAAGALAYAAIRLAEAYGLWRDREWAKWLGAVSGGIYVPVEIYEFARHATALRALTLIGNVAIVAYLGRSLRRKSLAGRGEVEETVGS